MQVYFAVEFNRQFNYESRRLFWLVKTPRAYNGLVHDSLIFVKKNREKRKEAKE